MVQKIDFQEAGRLLEEEKNAVLLDVCGEDENIIASASKSAAAELFIHIRLYRFF